MKLLGAVGFVALVLVAIIIGGTQVSAGTATPYCSHGNCSQCDPPPLGVTCKCGPYECGDYMSTCVEYCRGHCMNPC